MKLASLLLFIVGAASAGPCFAQTGEKPERQPWGISGPVEVIPTAHLMELQDLPVTTSDTLDLASISFPAPAELQQQSSESGGVSSSARSEINFDTAGHEVEIFAGSGVGIDGFSGGNPMMNAGVRFGWLLTDRRSDRFFSNRFEFAVEVAPLFVAWQPGGAAYGFNFYAFALKWNFTPHGHIAPYFEMAGGAVVTNKDIPPGVNNFNFTPTASAGIRVLRGKYAWSIGFRWLHISDAGITQLNPGDDTVGFRVSLNRWLK